MLPFTVMQLHSNPMIGQLVGSQSFKTITYLFRQIFIDFCFISQYCTVSLSVLCNIVSIMYVCWVFFCKCSILYSCPRARSLWLDNHSEWINHHHENRWQWQENAVGIVAHILVCYTSTTSSFDWHGALACVQNLHASWLFTVVGYFSAFRCKCFRRWRLMRLLGFSSSWLKCGWCARPCLREAHHLL